MNSKEITKKLRWAILSALYKHIGFILPVSVIASRRQKDHYLISVKAFDDVYDFTYYPAYHRYQCFVYSSLEIKGQGCVIEYIASEVAREYKFAGQSYPKPRILKFD